MTTAKLRKYTCRTCQRSMSKSAFYPRSLKQCKRCCSKEATARNNEYRRRAESRSGATNEVTIKIVGGDALFYVDGVLKCRGGVSALAIGLKAGLLLDLDGMEKLLAASRGLSIA